VIRVFNHWFPVSAVIQLILETSLWVGSVVLAMLVLGGSGTIDNALAVLPYALIFAVAMMTLNSWLGLYRRRQDRTAAQNWNRILVSVLVAIPVAYFIFRVLPRNDINREVLEVPALVAVILFGAWRVITSRGRAGPSLLVRRVLVLGTGVQAEAIEQCLTLVRPDLEIVGYFPIQGEEDVRLPAHRIVPNFTSVRDAAEQLGVDEVIVAVGERRGGGIPLPDLLGCKLAGVDVLDLASFYERTLGQVRLDSLRASWLIFGEGFRQGVFRSAVKRAFDVIAALALLLLALPLMLITAILIAADSGFPVLYRQERVGLGGRVFKVTKFRSMRNDAEGDGKPRWASGNDDRITRIGRLIRRTRIDELPQLFSVLKGDMSLVGPRPERPYFVDQLTRAIPFYSARHSVKPGVTGWAQVRYQYGASVEDAAQKLQYDLFYVKNHTLFLDLIVLFQTVGVVLSGEGAH
jgi:sugar transferase (PEP-CTERM system associated)